MQKGFLIGSDKFFTAVVRPKSSTMSTASSRRRERILRRRESTSSSMGLLPESVVVNLPLQIVLGTLCIVMGTAQVVSIPIYDQVIDGHSDFYVVTLITGFWFSILTFGTWIFSRVIHWRDIWARLPLLLFLCTYDCASSPVTLTRVLLLNNVYEIMCLLVWYRRCHKKNLADSVIKTKTSVCAVHL